MKRVLYVLTSLSHKRAFESLIERPDLVQAVVGPIPKITSAIVPEDYRDFKIKNIKYFRSEKELKKITDKFCPDVYMQADLSPIHSKIRDPNELKIAFMHHGAVGNHAVGINKKLGSSMSVWKGFDLYCGANKHFSDWAIKVGKAIEEQVLINASPQFDIIHDPNYYNSYRNIVLSRTKNKNAKKIVLFVGFCCKDRIDFNPHNEDYFRTTIELERIARNNDWLIMIKPRHTYPVMIRFLKSHSWGKKYIKKYSEIQNSKFLHFITTTGHIYRYFFADLFIVNGSSTVELEACAIGKPLVAIRTIFNSSNGFDPYNTVSSESGTEVVKISDIESTLLKCINKPGESYKKNQIKLIENHGITFDGKMYERVQNGLIML